MLVLREWNIILIGFNDACHYAFCVTLLYCKQFPKPSKDCVCQNKSSGSRFKICIKYKIEMVWYKYLERVDGLRVEYAEIFVICNTSHMCMAMNTVNSIWYGLAHQKL